MYNVNECTCTSSFERCIFYNTCKLKFQLLRSPCCIKHSALSRHDSVACHILIMFLPVVGALILLLHRVTLMAVQLPASPLSLACLHAHINIDKYEQFQTDNITTTMQLYRKTYVSVEEQQIYYD